MRIPLAVSRLCRTGMLLLFVALLGWTQSPPPSFAETAGPPPGYGRIWIYRYYEPYVSLATPYVRLNGQIVGVSQPGAAFYRDVPPGVYHVTVDSEGRDVDQFVTVAVAPGQQVYVQVQVSKYWDCGGGSRGAGWCRDTFYTRLQLPRVGAAAVASLPLTSAMS
jgi:hypothetical protein